MPEFLPFVHRFISFSYAFSCCEPSAVPQSFPRFSFSAQILQSGTQIPFINPTVYCLKRWQFHVAWRIGYFFRRPCFCNLILPVPRTFRGADNCFVNHFSFVLCADNISAYRTCVCNSYEVPLIPSSHFVLIILLFFCNYILFCNIPVDNTVLLC